jgi:Family of unknown function (DUF6011)
MFTKEQIALQTLCANGLIPAWRLNFAQSIASADCASPKQLFHVQKILDEIVNAPVLPKINAQPIFDLFSNAVKHLKYPKITLRSRCSAGLVPRSCRFSIYKKDLSVIHMNEGGYGSPYFGKLHADGRVELYRDGKTIEADILDLLNKFSADPAGFSAAHGKLTRNCCYCEKTLDTKESLAVGYGPVCAQHFGLPWGGKANVAPASIAAAGNFLKQTLGNKADWFEVLNPIVAAAIDHLDE